MPQLTPTDCPLLAEVESFDKLLERFNALDQVLAMIGGNQALSNWIQRKSEERESPSWQNLSEVEAEEAKRSANIVNRLSALSSLFRKRRYRVGFVGRSQVGKSSAVNALVGLEVLPFGAGGRACTSAVTRLQFFEPGSPDHRPQIIPFYQTRKECDDRIRFFAGSRNLKLLNDADIRAENVDELLQLAARTKATSRDPDKIDQLEKLEVLLLSKRQFPDLLANSNTSDEELHAITYGTVEELVTALPGFVRVRPDRAAKEALFREVTVRVPARDVSSTLEIIDLPGLGSTNIEEDELTLTYVRTLDGLVVFTNPDLVAGVQIKPLLDELKKRVGNVSERAWLIVSIMDQIRNAKDSYYSTNDKDLIFETVWDTVDRRGMLPEFARFLSVKKEIDGHYVLLETMTDADRYGALNVSSNADGSPRRPEALERTRYLPFRDAFDALLEDGGIGELRNICRTKIAEHVRNAEKEKVDSELTAVRQTLLDLIAFARRANARDVSDAGRIVAWASLSKALPGIISGNNKFYENAFKSMMELLWSTLLSLAIADNDNDGLSQFHEMIAEQLTRAALDELTKQGGTIAKSYYAAGEEMKRQAASNKLLKDDPEGTQVTGVRPIDELLARGESFREHLMGQLAATDGPTHLLINDLRSFRDADFITTIKADDYKLIMERKIEATMYGVLQRVHNQIGHDCDALFKNLRMIGSSDGRVQKFAEDEFFDDLERRLQ